MRTNVVLDDELMREAMEASDLKTKKDVIHEALRLYVRLKKRKKLTDLAGRIHLREGYDYKKSRVLR